ncbi:MAG TPA: NADH-quinone oxidoreductase subunit C [Acidobacteriaceae bacterium]|nr:NADH-quinone oxidoreductase subunit C [Acidobacteriaceae bacterium]
MDLATIKSELEASVPGCRLQIVDNPSPSAQHSLLVDPEHALLVATYLRDFLHFDYCSNVTGVDWLPKELSEKVKVKKTVDGPNGPQEKEVDEVRKTFVPGYLEVVYHLFSTADRTGPLPLRLRTPDRESTHLPSLTPIWRSCEFQEREVYDLFGIHFDSHPDLRRLLMWDSFTDHPMRRDYVDPDDYEYEPTAHDDVLARHRAHYSTGGGPSFPTGGGQ